MRIPRGEIFGCEWRLARFLPAMCRAQASPHIGRRASGTPACPRGAWMRASMRHLRPMPPRPLPDVLTGASVCEVGRATYLDLIEADRAHQDDETAAAARRRATLSLSERHKSRKGRAMRRMPPRYKAGPKKGQFKPRAHAAAAAAAPRRRPRRARAAAAAPHR